MRSLLLAKSGLNKVRANQRELRPADLEDSIKSIPPGEWCFFSHPTLNTGWVGFINPMIDEKYVCAHLLIPWEVKSANAFSVEEFIQKTLVASFQRRQRYFGYNRGARIFYGSADGLPGLTVDQFLDKAVIQINTAGVDKYRQLIRAKIDELIGGKSYFLDNAKYREKEFLPTFENESIPGLEIEENGIRFKLRPEVMQKVGFYYDHRENRYQLMSLLQRLNTKYNTGVDLFCYAGAWGLMALKAGVASVSFVDQGDFSEEIMRASDLNGFSGRSSFHRNDVFKFLDEAISSKQLYDLILCDPPAFAKSHSQKDQALEGYSKLHRKVLRAAAPGAFLAFSSCTHYVDHDEFQKNILDAATRENKKLQLVYCGMQGWDHPVSSLADKSNYIKSYFYLME